MSRSRKPRRAGSPWRLLVHQVLPKGRYGTSHHVTNSAAFGGKTPDSEHRRTHLIDGTEFDELVVGRWLHVEQMDSHLWWMNIGGVTINIRIDRDGRPYGVDVYGPGDYGEALEGVNYALTWSATTEGESPQKKEQDQ